MRPLETCYTKPLLFGELTQVTLITISSLLAVVSLARFMILAKKNARNRPIHPMHKYDSSVVYATLGILSMSTILLATNSSHSSSDGLTTAAFLA
jgi:hypothetical protein